MNPALLAMLLLVTGRLANAYDECLFLTPLVAGGKNCSCVIPWMVSLRGDVNNGHSCGGTLIAPTIVLTAAHCLRNGAPLTVDIGRVERDGDDGSGFETRNVIQAIQHEDFNRQYLLNNDVALLVLDEPSEKGVARLAHHDGCFGTTRGCEVRLFGWGKLCETCPVAETNQCAITRSIQREKCSNMYDAIFPQSYIGVSDTMICAGGDGKDTCGSDSGGPMVVNGAVVGIVSWGDKCADEKAPGVYASVPKLRDWIDEKLVELDIYL